MNGKGGGGDERNHAVAADHLDGADWPAYPCGRGAYLFVLLIARFFRWTNIRTMVLAALPRVESVGGEFAGARAELKLSQSTHSGLDGRVADLETKMVRVLAALPSDEESRRKKK